MPLIYQPIIRNAPSLSLPRVLQEIRRLEGPPEAAAQARAFLSGSSYQALRLLSRSHESEALNTFLSEGFADRSMCRRILQEQMPEDRSCRMALLAVLNPSDAVPQPEDPGTCAILARYMTRLGSEEPSFRLILGRTDCYEDPFLKPAGTDGVSFYGDPDHLQEFSYTDFLHMVMHCIFRHMRIPADADPRLWDLACDIAAEYNRAELFPAASARRLTTAFDESGYRLVVGSEAADLVPLPDFPAGRNIQNAAEVYAWLCSERDLGHPLPDASDYHRDDHALWHRPAAHAGTPVSDDPGWGEVLNRKPTEGSRRGFAPGSREEKMLLREQGRYDFRRYLRRFSVIREEVQLDPDSFDYIPYHYGLSSDAHMPFFEPLEYSEASKVAQLVIAIDTSGSCDRTMVQRFLAEVHRILTDREHIFRRMEVHILQCDSAVQHHSIIRSSEEWSDYIRDFTIHGRGGTDFTPVFRKVEELQQSGYLTQLKGLLYFTDGDGIYPTVPTAYETAFVFHDRSFLKYRIPDWVIPLCLEG